MRRYLIATGRKDVVKEADKVSEHLTGDVRVYEKPDKYLIKSLQLSLMN